MGGMTQSSAAPNPQYTNRDGKNYEFKPKELKEGPPVKKWFGKGYQKGHHQKILEKIDYNYEKTRADKKFSYDKQEADSVLK